MAAGEASLLKDEQLNWASILNAAVKGDGPARAAVEEYCDYLSCALVNMVNVFDPEIIYICQYESPEADSLLAGLLASAHLRAHARPGLPPHVRALRHVRRARGDDRRAVAGGG